MPKLKDGAKAKDRAAHHISISREADGLLAEMAEARGGGSARNVVIEEAIRLWYDQDPLIARRKKKTKRVEDGS